MKGDYSKAKELLGWEPKVRYKELFRIMVEYDRTLLTKKAQ
jgi:GDPmannose 4,6-dehydratase